MNTERKADSRHIRWDCTQDKNEIIGKVEQSQNQLKESLSQLQELPFPGGRKENHDMHWVFMGLDVDQKSFQERTRL